MYARLTCYAGEIALPEDSLIPGLVIPVNKYASEEQWTTVVTAGSFLPRVQLCGGNSGLVQEQKIGIGKYAFVRDKKNFENLGPEFNCLPLTWRFKAMKIPSNDDPIISHYDPQSIAFQQIQKESETPDSGCMYGIEFLIWVPSLSAFATFYFNSKTARRQAPNLKLQLGKAATFKAEFIEKGKFKWYGPVVTACSATITPLPTGEQIAPIVEKFSSPDESEIEETLPPETAGRPQ